MEEDKSLLNEVAADAYDASDRPFDFVEADGETALVCEADAQAKEKIIAAVKDLGYQITEASSARDALKKMRFHVYDLVVLNETFDTQNPDANDILVYLQSLAMGVRRQMFIALISDRLRTMDDMAAFHKSVNLAIHPKNVDAVGTILKRALADNAAFYRIFKEAAKKTGKA
jgi:DNA-binding NtrC family response regulator